MGPAERGVTPSFSRSALGLFELPSDSVAAGTTGIGVDRAVGVSLNGVRPGSVSSMTKLWRFALSCWLRL
jgi:hypothetical protein